jgi:hypothetical protein
MMRPAIVEALRQILALRPSRTVTEPTSLPEAHDIIARFAYSAGFLPV